MSEEKFIRNACRIMFRPISPYQDFFLVPQTYKHIVDPHTFEKINRWDDIGATKTGVCYTDEWIKTGLAEMTLERIERSDLTNIEFVLAALWQHRIQIPEERERETWAHTYVPDPHDIRFKYWHRVRLTEYWKSYIDEVRGRGECSNLPMKFMILP